jgi:putative transposase
MSRLDYSLFSERHLPHYQPCGADFFVTFRLAGSISKEQLRQLLALHNCFEEQLDRIDDPADKLSSDLRFGKILFQSWDDVLNSSNSGPLWLQEDRIASIVADTLHWGDGREYALRCFCIMPYHGHIVINPFQSDYGLPISLSRIMHSIKRFSAQKANLALGRMGDFWQHESYDRAIRDDNEFRKIINYILMNPVSAGLVKQWSDWKWTYVQEGIL